MRCASAYRRHSAIRGLASLRDRLATWQGASRKGARCTGPLCHRVSVSPQRLRAAECCANRAWARSAAIGIRTIRPGVARADACEPLTRFPAPEATCQHPIRRDANCSFRVSAWQAPWPPESEKRALVVVSLSTLPQGQESLLRNVLLELSRLDVRALVTLGPSLDPTEFVAPPNVVLERFVPHSAVLPQAAVLVTQCGIGTVTKGLVYGVPLVCVTDTCRSTGQRSPRRGTWRRHLRPIRRATGADRCSHPACAE